MVVEPGLVELSLTAGGGAGISIERRVSSLVGVEFGITAIGTNIDLSAGVQARSAFTSTDILMMAPLTLGANFHFVKNGPVDVYAGPMLAYARYSELSTYAGVDFHWWPWIDGDGATAEVRATENSELTWGARAGLGVFFGSKRKWSAQFALTFLDATYTFEQESQPGKTSISLDPLIFGLGFGFRF